MQTTPYFVSVIAATLLSAGAVTAHAADGVYYDPSNVGSSTGKTTDYEINRTIGCPGKQILDVPCKVSSDKPVDSDGDGVIDSKDKCPNTPAGRKVNADGCELDSDGDGIVDSMDKCPTVFAKSVDGCPPVAAPAAALAPAAAPVPAPASKIMVLEGVNFDNDQATLRQQDIAVLDQAVNTLKEWGDVKVEVAGHTDNRSSDSYNMDLSARRAEAVRNYLISKGISADRLTAKGYGESMPIADNNTEEGRFKNRRVELIKQ